MTTYPFTPAIGQNISFNPTLNSNTYTANITWNIFGQRWYLNLYDSNNNLIIATAVVSSDDTHPISSISWTNNLVTVESTTPHFLKLGTLVNLAITGNNPSGYNGMYQCAVSGPSTFTYKLTANPGNVITTGQFGGIADLCAGQLAPSALVYYSNNSQFATLP